MVKTTSMTSKTAAMISSDTLPQLWSKLQVSSVPPSVTFTRKNTQTQSNFRPVRSGLPEDNCIGLIQDWADGNLDLAGGITVAMGVKMMAATGSLFYKLSK